MGTSRVQGKRLAEPSQPKQTEARRKARYDTTLFSSIEDYQRYKFEGLFGRMGWLPVVTISELIFPTLVRAFYSQVTYGLGGPVLSTVRGVEIRLSPESIYHILNIPSVGLRVSRRHPMAPRLGELSDRPGDRDRCILRQRRRPRLERWRVGPSSQPSFIELPSQAPHAPDHAPWMDVSAQISSLGTRVEELALVHDSRFYSMEEHMD
uniref:Uncharacterized protein n=1 Tax=Vitis vinifera TaxID=29760 RepID=A5BMB4_VITVI|nr:hypothetical protein VITISV_041471 [Vitis vinifera]